MQIAEELGLPIESINQTAAYFLPKIPRFREHLLLLHRGKKTTIFRPDVYLYIHLKLARLSETDLKDCEVYLKSAKKRLETVNHAQIEKLLLSFEKSAIAPQKERIKKLLCETT
jgi:hypothetical protein